MGAVGQWSEEMLKQCADHMNLISEHIYWQNKPTCLPHVAQVPAQIREVADAHREYRRKIRRAGRQGHPHRDGRVELLVRPERVR